MASKNRTILISGAGCILAVASLCMVAISATQRPTKARRKRPRRRDVALKIGQMAPDFELYTLKHALAMQKKTAAKPAVGVKSRATSQPTTQPAEGKVRLSSFRGKRPVYLIFASYT
ncbi:MAG: hypothetical protein QGH60_09210 [Phycisphaerae bacterium]|jgi:hypothetical protein|nr:hypothetical protein [Phycisphaerae bacterium]